MTTQSTVVPTNWRGMLSAGDRRALSEDGLLHIRAAADASAVDAMRAAWSRHMAEPAFPERGNNDGPAKLDQDSAFAPCLEHPYVMSAVAQLLDGDVHLLGFRGRDPHHGSGQQGFHTDAARPVPAESRRGPATSSSSPPICGTPARRMCPARRAASRWPRSAGKRC